MSARESSRSDRLGIADGKKKAAGKFSKPKAFAQTGSRGVSLSCAGLQQETVEP